MSGSKHDPIREKVEMVADTEEEKIEKLVEGYMREAGADEPPYTMIVPKAPVSGGKWTVERIRLNLERLRGEPVNGEYAHISTRAFCLPDYWLAFAESALLPLPPSVQQAFLDEAGPFANVAGIGSSAWHEASMRDEFLAAQRLPAAEKVRIYGHSPQVWWDQLLGFFRRDGRNPDKGKQLDPALVPVIQRLGAVLEPEIGQRAAARLVAEFFASVLLYEHHVGSEKIRQVLLRKSKPTE